MKGTEKQIKWATDIINGVMETIRANKVNAQNSPIAPIRKEAEVWEYMLTRFEAIMQSDKMQDASWIISHRDAEMFQPLKMMSRIETASRNLDGDMMAAAKKILG